MNPPLPSEISAFEPPSHSEFPVTFRGGGVWIFSGTTHLAEHWHTGWFSCEERRCALIS